MSIAGYYFLVSLLCGLFSLFRFSVSLGLLERPLVIGFVWAVITGDWLMPMYVAIFFELAWLDLIPVGTFIPPHLSAATLSTLALAHALGMYHVSDILVAIVVSIPLAWIGTRLEARIRTRNSKNYNASMNWLDEETFRPYPERFIWRAISFAFICSVGGFFFCVLLLHGFLLLILPEVSPFLAKLDVIWPHLWVGGSLGGLLALRLRRAYAVFGAGLGMVMILTFVSIL